MNKNCVIMVFCIVLMSAIVSAHSYTPLNYYTVDNTLDDSGSQPSSLVSSGSPTYTSGVVGSALNAGVPYNDSVRTLETVRTIEFWYNVTEASGYMWYLGYDANNKLYCGDNVHDGDNIECHFQKAGVYDWKMDEGVPSTDNTWRHYVILMGVGGTEFYINGIRYDNDPSTSVLTANYDYLTLRADNSGANGVASAIDNLAFFEERFTGEDINWSYNNGLGRNFSAPAEASEGDLTISLLSPVDSTFNNTYNQAFSYNYSSNTTAYSCNLFTNETGNFVLEETTLTPTVNTTLAISHSFVSDGNYIWNVGCNLTNGTIYYAPQNYTLTLDTVSPIIYPDLEFDNNNKFVVNGTLVGQINFSDDREIYSVNITWGNGSALFGQTNIGTTNFYYNISSDVDNTIRNNITARVCDAHTAKEIMNIETYSKTKELNFIMDKFLIFETEWIKVYPKDTTDYDSPSTYKSTDRYVFIFNKQIEPSYSETFIVESSHKIDIAKKQDFSGHLIIPEIGKNGYWIDFENDEATDYQIKKINDYKVEITIYGLKSKTIQFNSIGELNCVSETFVFNNINPTLGFDPFVLSNNNNTFTLNITKDTNYVTSLNATLNFNHTDYFAGIVDNFSVNEYSPNVTDSKLIPLYWNMFLNGIEYNTSTYYQNVSNFFLDNCSDYSTPTINFTIYDESNNSNVIADATGTFYYTLNSQTKSYSLLQTGASQIKMCISPSYATFTGSYSIFYQSANYPQRRYYENNAVYDNNTQEIGLYVLDVAEGIYGRFAVVDTGYNPLENVTISMSGLVGSTIKVIEKEITDGSGYATFWVDPDKDYTFTFSKQGCTSQTQNLRITTGDPFQLTMDCGGSTSVTLPYSNGINYRFYPTGDLQNNTAYDFRFRMNSSYWDITGCTLYLKDGTTTLASSSTSYDSRNCDITINYNTNGYDTITSYVEYNLNSSSDIIVSKDYAVWYKYEGQFSLKNFIDDLSDFGEAGFNDFSRLMLSIIIISLTVGSMAFKFSDFREPEMLILITLGLIWLFSYVGWMRVPFSTIPTEWLKQYILAVLCSIGAGAALIKKVTD